MVAGVTAQPPLFDFTAADGVRHEVWRVPEADAPALAAGLRGDPRALHRRWPPSRGQRLPHAPGAEGRGARRARPVPRRRLPRLPDAGAALPPRRARPQRPHAGGVPGRAGRAVHGEPRTAPAAPVRRGLVAMYLDGALVDASISARRPPAPAPDAVLDVSRLQDGVLTPLLGIADVRTDKRIDFVGGIRGTGGARAAGRRRRVRRGLLAVSRCRWTT